ELPGPDGRVWAYRFVGERRFNVSVTAGRETVVALLEGLTLKVRHSGSAGVASGQEVQVTPSLRTAGGLELVNCEARVNGGDPAGASADIHLLDPDGGGADRTTSGFQ